jgi:hypothetical protein
MSDSFLRTTNRRNDVIREQRTTNYTITSRKYNRIAHIMPNINIHPELEDQPEYLAKLRSCLRNNLHNSCQQSIVELHGQNSTLDWVYDMCDYGFEAIIVWPDGTWPLGDQVEKDVTNLMDTDWGDNWLAAGMIINRMPDNVYPYWDYRYPVVINLKNWAKIGYPHFFNIMTGAFSFETEERVAITDSCPKYMFRSAAYKDAYVRDKFLDGLIGTALGHDLWIRGFKDEPLLEHIHHDDPVEDLDNVLSWIHENEIADEKNINLARRESDKLNEQRQELFTLKLLKYQIVYITNTEGVPKDFEFFPPNARFETLALPCSGLHQFYHIIRNIDTVKSVVWFDFNPYSVLWMKHLIENWDGYDFKKFVQSDKHVITDSKIILDQNIIYEEELVDEFLETIGLNEQEFHAMFLRIKELDHKFMTIDVVKEWEQLATACGENSNVFMQLTNIWQYEVNYMNTDGLDAQLAFLNLLNTVAKNNTALFLTGDTPMGIHYRYKNIKQLKGVF